MNQNKSSKRGRKKNTQSTDTFLQSTKHFWSLTAEQFCSILLRTKLNGDFLSSKKKYIKWLHKTLPTFLHISFLGCLFHFNKQFYQTEKLLLLSYREVAHTHWILEETLEAAGPAGHALLREPSVAACSWKTAITVQAALAAASLQLDSAVVCRTGERNTKVRGL